MWAEPYWVVVENTSPEIEYRGQWVPREPTPDMMNNYNFYGPPFSKSLRAARGTSTILFNFTGRRIQVHGTVNNLRNFTVDVSCLIDGEPGNTHPGWDDQVNNHGYCDSYDISPTKPHTLNFTITVPDDDSEPMLFDKLIYIPTNSTKDMDKALVSVDDGLLRQNNSVEYDRFWTNFNDQGTYADTRGAKAVVNFNGTSFSWFSFWFGSSFPATKSTGSYSMDDQPAIPFDIPAIPEKITNREHEPLFKVDNLSPGGHRVEVTYTSESKSGRPLALDYVVIQNEPIPTSSQTPAITTQPPSPSQSSTGGQVGTNSGLSQDAKIGIGVGAGLGGLLILLFAGLLVYRRRRTTQSSSSSTDDATQPAMSTYNPTSSTALTSPATNLNSNSTSTQSVGNPFGSTDPLPASEPDDDVETGGRPVALMYHEDSGIRLDDEMNPRPADVPIVQGESPPTYRKGH